MELVDQTGKPLPNASEVQAPKRGFIAAFKDNLTIINWVLTILIAIGVFYLSQRDLQTIQAQDIRDNKQGLTELKLTVEANRKESTDAISDVSKRMVTNDKFDATHNGDSRRMDRMENLLEQILFNQTGSRPLPNP